MSDAMTRCECCDLSFHSGPDEMPFCGPCGRRRGVRPPMPVEDIDQRFFENFPTECEGRCVRRARVTTTGHTWDGYDDRD